MNLTLFGRRTGETSVSNLFLFSRTREEHKMTYSVQKILDLRRQICHDHENGIVEYFLAKNSTQVHSTVSKI